MNTATLAKDDMKIPIEKVVPAKPLLRAAEASAVPEHAWGKPLSAFFKWLLPPVLGLALFISIWAMVAQTTPTLPGPFKTWASAVERFSDPFYDKGPNDQGIGWNI